AQLRANWRGSRSVRPRCKKRIVSRPFRTSVAAKQISHQITELPVSLALVIFNNSAWDALNLRVMVQHMHTPIAPSKKCAQNPAHDTDHYRAPERTPEVVHVESDDYAWHYKKQQRV